MLLLGLESPDVVNTYLRSTPIPGKGMITFSGENLVKWVKS
ncbi:unnamed protein product [Protopolystoma xenopodis]|uniref:Uncharacterized protein n=1 Tax=Protopolystoma xenopodis TaxID=117903 RepID=A0A448XIP6_9PLAT|nr:unnamed protein product [Protopolystoma xenopodis]